MMSSRKRKVSRAGRRRAAICVMLVWTLATLSFCGCRRPGQAVRIENESVSPEITEEESAAADMTTGAVSGPVAQAGGEEEALDVSSQAATIYVHVCGQVLNPGVYELQEGSRVTDAVEAAGGFGPEAATQAVNLAAHVADGSKLVIPSREEAAALSSEALVSDWYEEESRPASAGSDSGAGDGIRIDINEASAGQLTAIPGIGRTRAEAIVAYREENGRFGTIEDIMKVTGIKEGLFGKIKDYITVGG